MLLHLPIVSKLLWVVIFSKYFRSVSFSMDRNLITIFPQQGNCRRSTKFEFLKKLFYFICTIIILIN